MVKSKDELHLIQVRVNTETYKALVERMNSAGDIAMAAYVRRILIDHLSDGRVSHGKK